MRHWIAMAGALVVAVAVGCTAEPVAPASGEVVLADLDIPVGGTIAEKVWMQAPAGCEGRLEGVHLERIAWAENAPGLGVVLDEDGELVCVDTLESITIEIERVQGDPSPDPMYPKAIP